MLKMLLVSAAIAQQQPSDFILEQRMEQPRHFLLIEISEKEQQATVCGCPSAFRMLADELNKLATEAESQGKIQFQNYFSLDWGGIDLEVRTLEKDSSCARSFSLNAWPSASFARQYLRDDT